MKAVAGELHPVLVHSHLFRSLWVIIQGQQQLVFEVQPQQVGFIGGDAHEQGIGLLLDLGVPLLSLSRPVLCGQLVSTVSPSLGPCIAGPSWPELLLAPCLSSWVALAGANGTITLSLSSLVLICSKCSWCLGVQVNCSSAW